MYTGPLTDIDADTYDECERECRLAEYKVKYEAKQKLEDCETSRTLWAALALFLSVFCIYQWATASPTRYEPGYECGGIYNTECHKYGNHADN